ncbi:MAG: phage portal protein, partial [Bacteroides sp.]|nr:phage portal protein [Bacteroides sp.]
MSKAKSHHSAMKLFQSVLNLFRRESVKSDPPARAGAISLLDFGDTAAMNVAAVYRCVKLLSESVANLPVQYLKRRGDIFTEDDQSRLSYLLNVQPDASVNAFDFWRRAVQNVLLEGNAYIIPFYVFEGDRPQVCRLALCGRNTVSHDTVNGRYSVS